MDLTALFDLIGEAGTTALGGLVIGMLFGAMAQRSRFCLRSAVIEFSRGSFGPKLSVWLLAFGMAVAGVQFLIAIGGLSVGEARQLSGVGSLSGALIGGAMFGCGMVLARGCASRLLVLSANGNLRSLLSGLIFAVVAQASLHGVLAPLRDSLAGAWTISGADSLNVLSVLGIGQGGGVALGVFFLATALVFAVRHKLAPRLWIGALGAGMAVVLGWWLTWTLSYQTFEPTSVKSMSFTGPSADVLMLVLNPFETWDFDIGLVPGVFLGSFLAAALGRELKLEGFQGGASMRRYIVGAVLMGFGGMLAGGCAVGAGVTGGSIFALTAWLALSAMWAAASLTDYLVDRRGLEAEAAHPRHMPAP
jgi:uncharacterized membrane protein YedE/YeeE